MKISSVAQCASGAAAMAALILMSPSATYAAPAMVGAKALANEARSGAIVAKAANRRCWWRQGVRHCRRSAADHPRVREPETGFGYDYGRPRAEAYPFGSGAWWEAMEREGRVFRGPN